MSPLHLVIVITAAFAWFASLATGDTSWIDRLWSVLPETYVWVIALRAGLGDTRLNVLAILTTAWGLRLTFNFARRGGYTGTEDYRRAVLRSSMRRWQFQLFSLFFIVVYQSVLLVLIAMPTFTAYQHRGTAFGAYDALLTVLFIVMLVGERVADQQSGTSSDESGSLPSWAMNRRPDSSKADSFATPVTRTTSSRSPSGGSSFSSGRWPLDPSRSGR